MVVYLDSDFICHLTNDGTRRKYYTNFFTEDTPEKFIEGYRIVPADSTWIRKDGVVFHGEMITTVVDYSSLMCIKEQYNIDLKAKFKDLNILQEQDFTATTNYLKNSFVSIGNKIYKIIVNTPAGIKLILNQNIIESTIEQYLDSLKEE